MSKNIRGKYQLSQLENKEKLNFRARKIQELGCQDFKKIIIRGGSLKSGNFRGVKNLT